MIVSGSKAAVETAARDVPPGTARLIAFSLMSVPVNAAQVPLTVYLTPIYAQYFGLSLKALGLIFLLERIWGAAADPLIGMFSDRTRSRWGRRKPWIAAGALIFALAGVPMFFPSPGVTPLHLGVVLFAFYLGWSMIQIPYFAWSGELSSDYHQRTRIVTYQQVAIAISLVLVLILPLAVEQWRPGDGALKLGAMGAFVIASVILAVLLTLPAFPEPPIPRHSAPRMSLMTTLRLIGGETLLLRVLGSDFAINLAQNIRGTLFVFFVVHVAGLPQWAAGLFLLQFLFGILAGPIWLRVGYRFGKHQAAIIGELVQVACNLGLLFVTPGALPLLAALTVVQGLAQGSGNQMLRAIVADVADKHRLDTGVDRSALFFSVFSLAAKAAMAAAIGIALPLIAWFGFNPSGSNTTAALRGVALVFAIGPALAHVVAAWLVYGFPLDEQAHDRIRRALAERDAEPTVEPASADGVG
jgi:GPH family glycoside/pentoside/hexuronide:cation symporter